jgi:hypothetical protein
VTEAAKDEKGLGLFEDGDGQKVREAVAAGVGESARRDGDEAQSPGGQSLVGVVRLGEDGRCGKKRGKDSEKRLANGLAACDQGSLLMGAIRIRMVYSTRQKDVNEFRNSFATLCAVRPSERGCA